MSLQIGCENPLLNCVIVLLFWLSQLPRSLQPIKAKQSQHEQISQPILQ
jgi:hypothetical protein